MSLLGINPLEPDAPMVGISLLSRRMDEVNRTFIVMIPKTSFLNCHNPSKLFQFFCTWYRGEAERIAENLDDVLSRSSREDSCEETYATKD